jgi:type IV pilus assembly protein PilW
MLTYFRLTCSSRTRPVVGMARGFSLIEIMIGLAISLASILVIYQLYATSEGRRRTIAATSEAQTSGSLALYTIKRDIQSAGLGFGNVDMGHLGCAVQAYNSGRQPAEFEFPLVPVRIEVGEAGASDKLWVLSGSSDSMAVGARYTHSSAGVFTMAQTNVGFQAGDLIVGIGDDASTAAAGVANCLLMEVTSGFGTDGAAMRAVARRQGVGYQNFYTGKTTRATRNGGSASALLDSSSSNLGEGTIYSLGPVPYLHVWSTDAQRGLTRYNYLDETGDGKVHVAHDIIQFKAEYGYDGDGDGLIDVSSSGEWTATLTGTVRWERVLAVRIAVLMRTSQFEKEEVTSRNPSWANGSKEFVMDAAGSDWKHYRYRVYESIVPLRNVLWGQQR